MTFHTEATQGHNTGINAATTGATHDDHAPTIEATAIKLTMTHQIKPHCRLSTLRTSLAYQSRDHSRSHS